MNSDGAYVLYSAVRRVEEIIFEEIAAYKEREPIIGENIYFYDPDTQLNAAHSQMKQGMLLEYNGLLPERIWTPWGRWRLVRGFSYPSGVDFDRVNQPLLSRLGAKEFDREGGRDTEYLIYALHRVDDLMLPDPELREGKEYIDAAEAHAQWRELTQRYESENAQQ